MRAAAPLVVSLVVLAGCSGFSGGPDPNTDTVTPAPLPTDSGLPPGVEPDGVTDAETLAAAHGAVLSESSYTVVSNRTVRAANGSIRSSLDVRLRLSAERNYHADVVVAGPDGTTIIGEPPTHGEYWADDEVYLRRQTIDNRTLYGRYNESEAYVGTWRFWLGTVALELSPEHDLRRTLRSFETRIADREGGRVHLVGTEVRSSAFVDRGDVETVENATLHAFATESGFVESYHVVYDATVDGESVRVRRSVRFAAVGNTTVERPPWYDEAMARG